MSKISQKALAGLLVLVLFANMFTGCAVRDTKELSTTGFAFDTTYTITLYEGGTQEILNACIKKCSEYEMIFSRTNKKSELYQVNEIEKLYQEAIQKKQDVMEYIASNRSEDNHLIYSIDEKGKMRIAISEQLRSVLKIGLEYSSQSEGSFDITIEPISSQWEFSKESPKVPDTERIKESLPYVDYRMVSLEDAGVVFDKPGMGIDLGGIAKGYIADALKAFLKKQQVKSALINLGGNVLCLGKKDRNNNFAIGIQQPFADRNETICAVSVEDMSVVSSGIYERFFEEDGKLYHHILNPSTGYSYDNDLIAVTIISPNSVDGDALSTTCFSLGKEKGMDYIDSLEQVYALFIDKDEEISYSKGMKEFIIK